MAGDLRSRLSSPNRQPGKTDSLWVTDFDRSLRYERARADREGSDFSLVVYQVDDDANDTCRNDRLIEAVSRQCRGTDSIGWIDGRHLGVLLPSTGVVGCRHFVAKIRRWHPNVCPPCASFYYEQGCTYLSSRNGRPAPGKSCDDDGSNPDTLSAAAVAILEDRLKGALTRGVPAWKRILDVIGASVAALVFAPAAILLALYIKLVSPGPILFKQVRIGYRREPFTFLKFRTMHVCNDASEHSNHLKDLIRTDKPMVKLDERGDPRIIPGGRIIRKACLDELPQLINVLQGEMSLVGPRPCLPYEVEEYLRWHGYRFDVLPGITGLWQVSGKNRLTFRQMIRLDICYCRTMSLWLDLKVLLLTPPAVAGMIAEAVSHTLRPTGSTPSECESSSGGTIR